MADVLDENALLDLDDSDFAAESEVRLADLWACPDKASADVFYRERVAPLERARVRRMTRQAAEEPLDLLFVTAGTQADAPGLAVLATRARFVVLLCTQTSHASAVQVVQNERLTADRAAIRSVGDGKDALQLYRTCFEEWRARGSPTRLGFDLTGGLKTMSAATAAAAFAIAGARVFYVDGDQTTHHDRVRWTHQRRVELDNPFEVFGEIDRQSARRLLADARYGAAARAYEDLHRRTGEVQDAWRAQLARAYEHFDALDFRAAAEHLETLALDIEKQSAGRRERMADELAEKVGLVRLNARAARALCGVLQAVDDPASDPVYERRLLEADACLDFIAALIAIARRALGHRQVDVAALVAYRASEAILQRRLVLRLRADPARPDWPMIATSAGMDLDTLAARVNATAGRKDDRPWRADALPRSLDRSESYLLLKALDDSPLTRASVEEVRGRGNARNRSVLAHGFALVSPKVAEQLVKEADDLLDALFALEDRSRVALDDLRRRHRFVELAR